MYAPGKKVKKPINPFHTIIAIALPNYIQLSDKMNRWSDKFGMLKAVSFAWQHIWLLNVNSTSNINHFHALMF